MRRFALRFAFFFALFAAAARADDQWVGTLTSTGTSVNNTTTVTPFSLIAGAVYSVQCDASACINTGQGNAVAASCGANAAGVLLAANQLYDVPMVSRSQDATLGSDHIAMISVSGTANCKVNRVVTP